ncbi:MAG TPA: hypothetical protein VMG99_08125 [Thermoplasmata archaeon]|jgi:hypothetical protein|nr:hypothetical protein [Thermoplasmata archaeon]
MAAGAPADPVRSTLVAILQQLNRAESVHEGRERDQSLSLVDLERLLRKHPPVEDGQVKVALALGLLVRNRFVEADLVRAPATRGAAAPPRARYRITVTGKQFLVDALQKSDRIT